MKKLILWLFIGILSLQMVLSSLPLDELFYPVTKSEIELCQRGTTLDFGEGEGYSATNFMKLFLQTSATLQATKKYTPDGILYEYSWYIKANGDYDVIIEYLEGNTWKEYAKRKLVSEAVWSDYKAEYSQINMTKMRIKFGTQTYVTNIVELE